MFIAVIPSVIRVSTPVIDVNLAQTTHEELKEQRSFCHRKPIRFYFSLHAKITFTGKLVAEFKKKVNLALAGRLYCGCHSS